MAFFKIKRYTKNGDVMLVRFKEQTPSPGLPSISTQTILMNDDEINDLMKVLEDYANERRNTGV
jgi:hypothetical protein